MKTTYMPAGHCPDCDKFLDACTDPDSNAVPAEGDFGICIGCQGLHVFTKNLSRRRPTEDELLLLPLDVLSRYQCALTALERTPDHNEQTPVAKPET